MCIPIPLANIKLFHLTSSVNIICVFVLSSRIIDKLWSRPQSAIYLCSYYYWPSLVWVDEYGFLLSLLSLFSVQVQVDSGQCKLRSIPHIPRDVMYNFSKCFPLRSLLS